MLRIERFNFEVRPRFNCNVRVFINVNKQIKTLMDNVRLHRSGHVLGSAGCIDEEDSFEAQIIETETYYKGYPVAVNGLAETKEVILYKEEWKVALSDEDAVISVHIPVGGKLDEDSFEKSYSNAKKIIIDSFPEYHFNAFICISWLMATELKEMLKSDSNILKFQEKYMRFPRRASGKDVFFFVFLKPYEILENMDLKSLPEKTSLESKIKKYYIKGNYIREIGGFILI